MSEARTARTAAMGEAGVWMAGAITSFSLMAVAGRELSDTLAPYEIMAWRSLIGVAAVAAFALATTGRLDVATAMPGRHAARNLVHFVAQNAWFAAIALIPLAQVVAIEFTNPVWVALLAPLLLGERLTRARLMATALGFLGVLVVTRPGLAALDVGHAFALAAAIGFALTNMATRRLGTADGAITVLFWMTLSQTAMGFLVTALALGHVPLPPAGAAPWVLAIGACGLSAHTCLTRALIAAPASVVAPMEFLRLPVIALLGAALYGEALEAAVFLGAGLIVAGNLVSLRGRT
ncbi:MAG: DMT family transporter [Paracoccaceae bacterium]